MKDYFLSKIEKFGLKIKKINYNFKIEKTNNPTHWIKIIIHHTGKSSSIQDIINLHINKNKYSSIGYHFLIDSKGQIYLSRDLNSAGAHTFKYNKNSIGIALIGNLNILKPTNEQINSLNSLISKLKKEYKIKKILGHNQAIYDFIKNKFWKLHLPNTNPIEIETYQKYEKFIQEINTKILEHDASHETINTIKKLTTCPGFNFYQTLLELETKFKKEKN